MALGLLLVSSRVLPHFFCFLTTSELPVKKDETSCLKLKVTYKELELFVGLCFSQKPSVIISHTSVFAGTVLCHFKLLPSSKGKDGLKLLKNLSVNIILTRTEHITWLLIKNVF